MPREILGKERQPDAVRAIYDGDTFVGWEDVYHDRPEWDDDDLDDDEDLDEDGEEATPSENRRRTVMTATNVKKQKRAAGAPSDKDGAEEDASDHFGMVPRWVSRSGIGAGPVHLYAVLADLADRKEGKCWPKVSTLAGYLQAHESTVRTWTKKLEDAGFIRVEERIGHSNMYYVARKPPKR
jgi:hypothetical protein